MVTGKALWLLEWAGGSQGVEGDILVAECMGGRSAPVLRTPLTLIQEELEFCEKLLQTCFSSPTDDSMDR